MLLFLLLALVWRAGSCGLAHLQVVAVENVLKRWQQSGQLTSERDLELALKGIDRAIALHRNNPYQLSLKARLLEWRAYASPEAEGRTADYRAALALYKEAAELRPMWPQTWAEMINVKLNLAEVDEELQAMIRRADKVGPYTPAVHSAIVRGGYAMQQLYPFARPPLLEQHLLRGLTDRRSHADIQRLVQEYDQRVSACRAIARAPEPRPRLRICGT
ncbi:VpsP family polysaccharide biosynthesis protein [Microbulbifer aestuariivivens]|uniref:VpsP family polysaccharide biosynthesis protein n=1 Tax=Microbulbifer aestuariivivens TaxID=1908308 RepID=UPI0031EBD408